MRSGVAGQLVDFSEVVANYASFAGDPLCARSLLRDVRKRLYKRRLHSFATRYSGVLTAEDIAEQICDSEHDVVNVYGDSLNLRGVNSEAGVEYILAVSHLNIPFSSHPGFYKTPDAIDQAIMDNPFVLSEISHKFVGAKALAVAISKAALALGMVDIRSCTYESCVDAVRSFPEVIELIPSFLMTREIVRLAMIGNPHFALRHVPLDMLDREILLEAVKSEPSFLLTLVACEGCYLDDDIVITAVSMMPSLLLMLPRQLMTKKLFSALLEHHPELISIVPVEMLTEDVAAMVVMKKPDLVEKVPREIRGVKVCAAYAEHYSRGFSRYFSRSVIDAYKAKRPAIRLNDELGDIPSSIKIRRIPKNIPL
ncbi:hypothetical protein F3I62_18780 [Pseudomonas sp. R-28-1W-6]|uniref:hypothetical protein n=1 Tax=Pseudomonas sp. R-28-1W-6 TaxID=2650101 RepID=UPI001365C8C4|nr:hypothetical protein [Pseudomonas sp. R-28-1W-6]MWV14150.1 hypothetical protein [Pseudomonas sp. R-28-1W-6]